MQPSQSTSTYFTHRLLLCLAIITWSMIIPHPSHASPFSVGQERDVGDKMRSLIRKEFKLIDEPDTVQYINTLGQKVLKIAGPQYFNYQFFVVNNKEFNAFAAPSGLIFIHTGLVSTMKNEDELLSVIAHEIGHVAHRHLADRIDKAGKINIGTIAMILAGIALGASGEGELSEAVVTGAMATSASFSLKFSRENEEEADRLAFNWMTELDRNPESMLSMLSRMRRISILKIGKVPSYLLTHPDPAQRMSYVQDLINQSPPTKSLPEKRGFDFNRFRYRILARSGENRNLLPRLAKKVENGKDKNYMSRLGLGILYMQEGNFVKARSYLQQVINEFPTKAILLTDLGLTYLKEGNRKKAIDFFEKARQMDRDCAYTAFNLAKALDQSGVTDRAIELYQELLITIPSFATSHYFLGQALSKKGDVGKGHYHTAVYSWLEGNSEGAKYHFKSALKKLPSKDPYIEKCKEMLLKIDRLEKL